MPWGGCTPRQYRNVVLTLLNQGKPSVFVLDGGEPDPVYYRTQVATPMAKHYESVCSALGEAFMDPPMVQAVIAMYNDYADQGTDVLQLTIEACRQTDTRIIVGYRMNSEDYYHMELQYDDFARAHRHLAIPGANCLDPANVEVYMHRLDIFREVAENYDIDGLELNWRRWWHMISNPLHNYPVLTRMIADVRRILDDAAAKKGRGRMILGVRVSPHLDGPFDPKDYPGCHSGSRENPSCRELGLDVKTWIESGHLDYVTPAFFNSLLPGIPRVRKFAELASGNDVGIYPTLAFAPRWLHAAGERMGVKREGPIEPTDTERMLRHKDELCQAALQLYEQGADGIATFNWWPHHQPGIVSDPDRLGSYLGYGAKQVMMKVCSVIGDRAALQADADSRDFLQP